MTQQDLYLDLVAMLNGLGIQNSPYLDAENEQSIEWVEITSPIFGPHLQHLAGLQRKCEMSGQMLIIDLCGGGIEITITEK